MRKAVFENFNRSIWPYASARSIRLGLKSAVSAIALFVFGVAEPVNAGQIQTVFVIATENHNWTQQASQTSPGQILESPYAP
jgi:hypothetical protein